MTNGKGVGIVRKDHEWDGKENNNAIKSPKQEKKIEEINYVVYSLNATAKTITPITDNTRDTDTIISAIFL